jgi:hypothetical protein
MKWGGKNRFDTFADNVSSVVIGRYTPFFAFQIAFGPLACASTALSPALGERFDGLIA